jgi:hypothetical protein
VIPGRLDVTVPLPVPAVVTVRARDIVKSGATVESRVRVTVQVGALPLQPPPQRSKTEPASGVAVRATVVFGSKDALHVAPQSIPAGSERTLPRPLPVLVILRTGGSMKAAPTSRSSVSVTVQVGVVVPVQSPPQRSKNDPGLGVAVRVTELPKSYTCVQALPQSIPGGDEVTLPLPVPPVFTVRVWGTMTGSSVKFTDTVRGCVMVSAHTGMVPLQSPPQPLKLEPTAGSGVRVI